MKLYKVKEVADLWQIRPVGVYRLIKSGELEVIKIGRLYRISSSAMEKFVEENLCVTVPMDNTKAPLVQIE